MTNMTITTKADAMAAELAKANVPLTHKEMTAHLRKRLKHEGVKARVNMREYCGVLAIAIDPPVFEYEFTEDEQRTVRTIAKINGLTLSQGMEIDIEQMTDGKGFHFVFHGSKWNQFGERG